MTELEVAELVRAACVRTFVEAYEMAAISGLCHQGSFDVALDAMKSLDLEPLLKEAGFPGRLPDLSS